MKQGHEVWGLDLNKRTLAWHRDLVHGLWGVGVSSDNQAAYVGDQVGTIHALRAADGWTIREYKGPESPVNELAISTDGRYLLSASNNREIRLWDRAQGKVVRHLASGEDSLGDASFTSDGRTLIARYDRFYLGFWHVTSGQRLMTVGPCGDENVCWGLSPDGRTIYMAYMAVHEADHTSVRTLTLDGQSP